MRTRSDSIMSGAEAGVPGKPGPRVFPLTVFGIPLTWPETLLTSIPACVGLASLLFVSDNDLFRVIAGIGVFVTLSWRIRLQAGKAPEPFVITVSDEALSIPAVLLEEPGGPDIVVPRSDLTGAWTGMLHGKGGSGPSVVSVHLERRHPLPEIYIGLGSTDPKPLAEELTRRWGISFTRRVCLFQRLLVVTAGIGLVVALVAAWFLLTR